MIKLCEVAKLKQERYISMDNFLLSHPFKNLSVAAAIECDADRFTFKSIYFMSSLLNFNHLELVRNRLGPEWDA
jgi:hypothetical protein